MFRFDSLNFFRFSLLCLLATVNVAAQSGDVSQWKSEQLIKGVKAQTPQDLKPGETYSLILYGAQNLNGQTLSDFLKQAIQNDPLSLGEIKDLKIEAPSENYVTATGAVFVNGTAFGVAYIVVGINRETIYLARVFVSNQNGLSARYQVETQNIVSAAVKNAKNQVSVAKSSSGVQNALPAITPDGLGGKIVEGIYVGEQLYDEKEVRNRLRLYLYTNGEYRMLDENGKAIDRIESLSYGEYKYDLRTGQISVGGSRWDLSNDSDNPRNGFVFTGAQKERLLFTARDISVLVVSRLCCATSAGWTNLR